MGKILYFDCFSGISGDMAVAALLDLGIEKEKFLSQMEKLKLEGYQIRISSSTKNGIVGTDFSVLLEKENEHNEHNKHHEHHVHRNINDIEQIIEGSGLKENVVNMSKKIFRCVANAESKVHGKPIEKVHFHEVGAVDSIIDIVGFSICMDLLGVEEVHSSPLHVGSGFVKCAHGIIPVPAPAVLEILKGVPIYNKGIREELVTPTGAAIVKSLSQSYGDITLLEIEKIGYGLGKRDLQIPNAFRVYLAEKKSQKISW